MQHSSARTDAPALLRLLSFVTSARRVIRKNTALGELLLDLLRTMHKNAPRSGRRSPHVQCKSIR
jgi:hypothetical protein